MTSCFTSTTLAIDPCLVERRRAFLESTAPPRRVMRMRPQYQVELKRAQALEAVGQSVDYPEQYEEIEGSHYADAWSRYVHPDGQKLQTHMVTPHSVALTREMLDAAQTLISQVCVDQQLVPVLIEELIHEQETGQELSSTVSLPPTWLAKTPGSNLDTFLAWISYWLLREDWTRRTSCLEEDVPVSELDPASWWSPAMNKLYEEVSIRRSRSHVDHKLAMSRDLSQRETTIEIGNRYGFTGLAELVTSYPTRRETSSL